MGLSLFRALARLHYTSSHAVLLASRSPWPSLTAFGRASDCLFHLGVARLSATPGFSEFVYSIRNLRLF